MHKKAFTLVELIVVITILAILGTIGIASFNGYSLYARDSIRIYDLANINKSIEVFHITSGIYPTPDGPISKLTYSGSTIFEQGFVGSNMVSQLELLVTIPLDPLTFSKYGYSKATHIPSYQIKTTLESNSYALLIKDTFANNNLIEKIKGNYNGYMIKTITGSINYILSLPTLFTKSVDSSVSYFDSNNLLIFDNTIINQDNTYNPIIIYSGNTLPIKNNEILTIMNKLKLSYSGTTLENIQTNRDMKLLNDVELKKMGIFLVNGLGGNILPINEDLFLYPDCVFGLSQFPCSL